MYNELSDANLLPLMFRCLYRPSSVDHLGTSLGASRALVCVGCGLFLGMVQPTEVVNSVERRTIVHRYVCEVRHGVRLWCSVEMYMFFGIGFCALD